MYYFRVWWDSNSPQDGDIVTLTGIPDHLINDAVVTMSAWLSRYSYSFTWEMRGNI